MARDTFVATPFIFPNAADFGGSLHTSSGGEPSAVLELGPGLTMYVYDPAVLLRLAEVVARGHDLLSAELSGQDPLPVDRQRQADDQLVDTQTLEVA